MTEPRRRDMTQAEIQNPREGVFYDNDQAIEKLKRPQIVNSAPAIEDNRLQTTFDNQEAATYTDRSIQNTIAPASLFSSADVEDLRTRWGKVQTGFVDEPRWAVQEADKLVTRTMDRLTEGFTNERSSLEKQWGRGDDVSTEDLRLAFQRYRTFFDRLLSV